jgi:hypothetical protein
MVKLWAVIIAFVLSGCGTMKFDRPDRPYSEREFQADWTQCESMNQMGNSIPGRNFLERCMFGKGWNRTD